MTFSSADTVSSALALLSLFSAGNFQSYPSPTTKKKKTELHSSALGDL